VSKPVVLDTSAILAFVDDEPGADTVEKMLLAAEAGRVELFGSFVTITEARYITMQEQDEAGADGLIGRLKSWPVKWIHSDEQLCLLAGRFKAERRISLADAFVGATAFQLGAKVLHKDPEFTALADEIELQALPYKKGRQS
jgi:predicted nucleic acid-binding protein